MTNSVILAGASVRSLAESAVAWGVSPCCVDMFCDADLQMTLRDHGLVSARRIDDFSSIPGVVEDLSSDIPVVWTGGLENHPQVLRQLAEQRPVYGVSVDLLEQLRSAVQLKSLVHGSGCDVPETVTHAAERQKQLEDGDWLIKPRGGSGGTQIRRFESGSLVGTSEYRQRCVQGLSVSALYHSRNGITQMLGTCIQVTGESELGGTGFQFCGNVGPVQLPIQTLSILRRVGQRIGDAGIHGVFGADFMIDAADVWLIEVNPRITASHELYDMRRNSVSVLQRQLTSYNSGQFCAEFPPQSIRGDRVVARLIVYLKHDRIVTEPDVRRLLRFRRLSGCRRIGHAWLADIPSIGRLSAGTPFCSVYHVLRKHCSEWKTDTECSDEMKLNQILSEYTGIGGINTTATAIRYACLSERPPLNDNMTS